MKRMPANHPNPQWAGECTPIAQATAAARRASPAAVPVHRAARTIATTPAAVTAPSKTVPTQTGTRARTRARNAARSILPTWSAWSSTDTGSRLIAATTRQNPSVRRSVEPARTAASIRSSSSAMRSEAASPAVGRSGCTVPGPHGLRMPPDALLPA